ncbi:MAG TPA: heterodisulfide reductase-related iron-sulfur binding cluster [Trebonia sp.]|jgi:glycolate oxidase iron-sulfur subunit|nr:heterodisulfide reductase-related iron-sulfur binding cluster [Trebonia sp.]
MSESPQSPPPGHEGDESEQRVRSAVKDCVHCGFCLPACPTYSLWGEEMDSPRGRIHLVGQLLDGAPLTPATAGHFDRCLGCMACMTACPSGVQYDQIIEAAREWTEAGVNPLAGGGAGAGGAEADLGVVEGSDGEGREGVSAGGEVVVGGGVGVGGGGAGGGAVEPGLTAPRPLADRLTREAIFALFPYPRRLRVAIAPLRLAQRTGADRLLARTRLVGRVSPAAEQALRLAPASRREPPGQLPERVAALGPRRAVVGMLTGCVQSVFFPGVNAATARVLAAEGCDVVIPRSQGCCGALSLHSGRAAEAARFARQTIETFEAAGVDTIVVNSAGCGSAMKEYERLFAALAGGGGDARAEAGASPEPPGQAEAASWAARAALLSSRVRDLTEFLDALGPVARRRPVPMLAAYHDACHLGHAQRITAQPRSLLRAIPELELVELRDPGVCCGSAGVYNLLQPDAASALGSRKADSVAATGASLLISANPGCTLQISAALAAQGATIRTAHIAEVLDASINGVPLA